MNQTPEQKKDAKPPVISPLANERTYGERVYSNVFDWGLNYWTNLISSALFSQWAEHATRPVKIPFLMKEAATPRQIQENLAGWLREKDPMMKSFEKKAFESNAAAEAEAIVAKQAMTRARSLTLLTPGFAVMIPAVWLGAKIKPWFVEHFNRSHYGAEAMEDPSLNARHEAIRAEECPTLAGTVMARMGTVLAVQATAQLAGNEKNLIRKLGAKNFGGVDPVAEKLGTTLGDALPQSIQNAANRTASRAGLDWSNEQKTKGMANGNYTRAAQDFSRFVTTDTIYTLVSALTIRPLISVLKHLPLMSYKPKVHPSSATFDGNAIKVPDNHYADVATEELSQADGQAQASASEPKDSPRPQIAGSREHSMLTNQPKQQLA